MLDKTTCDGFASTPLAARLDALGIRAVVIAGLQSEFCIRETALGALERGYEVTLAADGHSTYDGREHNAAETSAAVNAELSARATLVDAAGITFGA